MSDALARYAHFMEMLAPETVPDLAALVTEDVYFKDPFNAVSGAKAMQAVFTHMFETLGEARFTVKTHGMLGDMGILYWQFDGRLRNRDWRFEGMSRVTFAADGRVASHIDHWDAAQDFYEHFPIIGHILRRVRQRIADANA